MEPSDFMSVLCHVAGARKRLSDLCACKCQNSRAGFLLSNGQSKGASINRTVRLYRSGVINILRYIIYARSKNASGNEIIIDVARPSYNHGITLRYASIFSAITLKEKKRKEKCRKTNRFPRCLGLNSQARRSPPAVHTPDKLRVASKREKGRDARGSNG